MAGAHALLSPSKAHRDVRCLGALAACKSLPPQPPSRFAAEGTAYHEVAAKCLESGADCESFVGQTIEADGFKFVIDEDNARYAQVYVDAIRRRQGEKLYEVKLDTSEVVGVPGQSGTGDAITLDYENLTIYVDDLKFGRGVQVYAEGNEQLIEYGAAALFMFDMLAPWAHVVVGIHQPRIGHRDEHKMTVMEVGEWILTHRPKLQEAYRLYDSGTPAEIRAALTPSEKACQWCPLAGSCPARANSMAAQFSTQPDTALSLTDTELAAMRARVDDIEAWCASIKTEALSRALNGAQLPGWKIVEGRKGNRDWDEGKLPVIEEWLKQTVGDEAYKPKEIQSPAKIDTLLNKKKHAQAKERMQLWENLQDAITQAPAGKSLVRVEDARIAVSPQKVEFGIHQ
jgi:hypothetical protein